MTTPAAAASIPPAAYYLSTADQEIIAAKLALKVYYGSVGVDPAAAGKRGLDAIDDAIRTLRDARSILASDIATAALRALMPPEPAAIPVEEPQPTGDPLVDEAVATLRASILGGSLTRRRAAELAADWPADTRAQLTDEQFEQVLSTFPAEPRIAGAR